MEDETIIKETQTESIKLYKNTKGYNWDIKLLGIVEEQMKRLKKLNDEMLNEYGSGN